MSEMKYASAALNLVLRRGDGSCFNAHLDCRRMVVGQAKPVLRIAITEFSEREPDEAAPLHLPDVHLPDAPKDQAMLPTPPAAAPVTVDVNALKALVGDEATIRDFLHDFRISAAKIAVELRTACMAGQTATAGAHAHKLKSSARSVGALCATMEQAGKAGDMKALAALLPKFEQELAGVEGFLEG